MTSRLLYTWRHNAMVGLSLDRRPKTLPHPTDETGASFAEVRIADPVAPPPPASLRPPEPSGRIAIELPSGIRLSVDASVDAEALGRVLSVLDR